MQCAEIGICENHLFVIRGLTSVSCSCDLNRLRKNIHSSRILLQLFHESEAFIMQRRDIIVGKWSIQSFYIKLTIINHWTCNFHRRSGFALQRYGSHSWSKKNDFHQYYGNSDGTIRTATFHVGVTRLKILNTEQSLHFLATSPWNSLTNFDTLLIWTLLPSMAQCELQRV